MSDYERPDVDDVLTRDIFEFGKDAVSALEGILHVLESLRAGYVYYNGHPPKGNFEALVIATKTLKKLTEETYLRGQRGGPTPPDANVDDDDS